MASGSYIRNVYLRPRSPIYRAVVYVQPPHPVNKLTVYNCGGNHASLPLKSVPDAQQHKVEPKDGVLSKEAAAVHHERTGIGEDTGLLVVLDSSKQSPCELRVEEVLNYYLGLATPRRPIFSLHIGGHQYTPVLSKDQPAAFLHVEHIAEHILEYFCELLDYHRVVGSRADLALKDIALGVGTTFESSLWHRFSSDVSGVDGPMHPTSTFGGVSVEHMSDQTLDQMKREVERIPGLSCYQVTETCELAIRCDPCHKEQAQPSIERLCKAFGDVAGVVSWEPKIKVISTDRWCLGVSLGKGQTDTLGSLGVLVDAGGRRALLTSCHTLLDHLKEDAEVTKERKSSGGSETWTIDVNFKLGRRFVAGRLGDPTPAVPLGTEAIGIVRFRTNTLDTTDITGDVALIFLDDEAPETVDSCIYVDDPDAPETADNGNPRPPVEKLATPDDVQMLRGKGIVYKCGQKTRRTKGQIVAIDSWGYKTKFLSNIFLRDLVSVRSETGYFSEKGDSGSPVWAEVGGECALLGTVTAVQEDSRETFVVLIQNQINLLGETGWHVELAK